MKTPRLTFALLTACAVLPASGLFAQLGSPAVPSTTPSVSAPAPTTGTAVEEEGEKGGDKKFYDGLTPEEKQKLRAANKVARQDPAVQAARSDKRAHRRAMREAMIKADPSVAAILEKRKEARHPGMNRQ